MILESYKQKSQERDKKFSIEKVIESFCSVTSMELITCSIDFMSLYLEDYK